MIIGGIHLNKLRSKKLSTTAPYIQDYMTWCVSRAKAIPRWKNVFFILDATIYIVGVISFILVIFCTYLLFAFEETPFDLVKCVIISLQVLIGTTAVLNPNRLMFRVLFGMFLFIGFWCVQIITAFLIAFISRVLYEIQIDSVEEIANQRYRLAGEDFILQNLNASNVVRFDMLFIQLYFFFIHCQFFISFLRISCALLKFVTILINVCFV